MLWVVFECVDPAMVFTPTPPCVIHLAAILLGFRAAPI